MLSHFGLHRERRPAPQLGPAVSGRMLLETRGIHPWGGAEAAGLVAVLRDRLARGETLHLVGFQGLFHNSGVALVEVSRSAGMRILANLEEERFSRRKHHAGYPGRAVAELRRLMEARGIAPGDLVCGCHSWDIVELERHALPSAGDPTSRWDVHIAFTAMSEEVRNAIDDPGRGGFFAYPAVLVDMVDRLRSDLGLAADWKVVEIPHHESHAHLAYGCSPFSGASEVSVPTLVACLDGNGDMGSASFFRTRDGVLELMGRQPIVDSIGNFYTLLASFLGGWTPLSSEGRYMGAAAWGCQDRLANPYYRRLREAFHLGPDGNVFSNRALAAADHEGIRRILGEFIPPERLWNPDAVLNLDSIRHAEATQDRVDKAAAVQMVFEDALFHLLDGAIRESGCDRVVLCGGVALNCVANLRLLEHFDEAYFRRVLGRGTSLRLWVPPIPSDAGAVPGAAMALAAHAGARWPGELPSPFLCGPGADSGEILEALGGLDSLDFLELGRITDPRGLERVADWMGYAVSSDAVLGLFQGGAETGPRALGHRSLLSNPRNPQTLETLNSRVKRRERIRPLAPMVTREEADRWFELLPGAAADDFCAYDYMVLTARARPEARERLPVIVHRDGTSRIQIVRPSNNPLAHAFLKAMGRWNGAEVSVNTSLNVGSPIVQTPTEALEVFRRARGLDGMILVGSDGRAFLAWPKPGTQEMDSRVPELWREHQKGGRPTAGRIATATSVDAGLQERERQRSILEAFRAGRIQRDEARRLLGSSQGPDPRGSKDSASGSNPADEPIAVIGMSARLPGAPDLAAFWANLRSGVDSVGDIPRERWDAEELFDPEPGKAGRIYCRRAGMLEGVDEFDPQFFNISPREAAGIEPQFRLLLQEIWRAVEDAGYRASDFAGRKVGVFVGGGSGDYIGRHAHLPSTEVSRISYQFDWKGPCMAVETSCSSGLVALHEACLHLQSGRMQAAVVGAASLFTTPHAHLGFSQMSMLSPQGRCFAFDHRADGTIFSEGVCALVLKPLRQAVADGDSIHGVIRATNINYDGRTNGITSPSGVSQTAMQVETFERHGIDPAGITLVEAHGTGTRLGDPVEANALIRAFRRFTDRAGFCALGSVKSNVGHTASAAGLTGLIKVLLSLRHREIPPTLHFERLNPAIVLDGSPFFVNTSLRSWEVAEGMVRRAAVNSFGLGGTNAHAIVEEAPPRPLPAGLPVGPVVIPLSAQSADLLVEVARRLLGALEAPGSDLRLADVAHTLQRGREPLDFRWACVVADLAALRERLAGVVGRGGPDPGCWTADSRSHRRESAAWAADTGFPARIRQWAAAGDWDRVAEAWVRGAEIDWDSIRSWTGLRIPLPTYPFARWRCWNNPPPTLRPSQAQGVPQPPEAPMLPTPDPVVRLDPPASPATADVPLPRRRVALVSVGMAADTVSQDTGLRRRLPAILKPLDAVPVVPRLDEVRADARPVPSPQEPTSVAAEPLEILASLTDTLAEALFLRPSDIDPDRRFIDLGLDSIVGVEWIRVVNQRHGLNLPATRVYDHPTLRLLAVHVSEELARVARPASAAGGVVPPGPPPVPGPVPGLDPVVDEPPVSGVPPLDVIRSDLGRSLAEALFLTPDRIDPDKRFVDMGLDSIVGVEWIRVVNQGHGLSLAATKIYDHPTLNELSLHVEELLREAASRKGAPGGVEPPVGRPRPAVPVLVVEPVRSAPGNVGIPGVPTTGSPVPEPRSAIEPEPIPAGDVGVVLTTTHTLEESRLSPWDPGLPGEGEIRIRVRASALNFPDAMCIQGYYPTMPEYPFVPGFEVAGEVDSVGPGVGSFKVGDRVLALTGDRLGGHASRVNVPVTGVVPMPATVTFEEACSLPVVFGTVHYAFELGRLKAGEQVLVQTATGGCGLMALQLARLRGCPCFGTSSSPAKRDLLRRLGVLAALDYKGPFDQEIARLTGGRGVDVVLNMVAGEAIQRGLRCLAPGGRYLELASHAFRTSPPLDLSHLTRNQTLHSIDLRRLDAAGSLPTREVLGQMVRWVEQGDLVPIVSRIYPLSRFREAIEHVATGSHIGKVVISHTGTRMEDLQERCIERLIAQQRRSAVVSLPGSAVAPTTAAAAAAVSAGQAPGVPVEPHGLTQGIAIVGMSGRFPKSGDLDSFWRNLVSGEDCISEVPAGRWSIRRHYDPRPRTPGKTDCRWMGMLEEVDRFDPLFFSIPPVEADWMDPQQRVFLEGCWHCLEDAGIRPSSLAGSRCGVFVGCSEGDYGKGSDRLNAQALMGGALSILAGRISYLLDLQGPCVAIDTACSSSLVAIAQACDSLVLGHCDAALAGGVCIHAGPGLHIMASQAGMLSRDGRCFSFDARANGFVPGEGMGVVMLKRLADAVRDGDTIHGVLRGWGVNQDGKTNGITAPSVRSQARLEREVHRRFRIDPSTISLVEAHGTGTQLGDPIEVEALSEVLGGRDPSVGPCRLGSVKSNIGHLLAAAGVSGLIKVLLALRHRTIPPSIHFQEPNPHLRLDPSLFRIPTVAESWEVPGGAVRRACVSSFGFSGTNAHLVVEEAPSPGDGTAPAPAPVLIVLSAKTRPALDLMAARLATHLRNHPDIRLTDVAATLQQGRDAFPWRCAIVAGSLEATLAGLGRIAGGGAGDGDSIHVGRATTGAPIDPALFGATGEGLHRIAAAWVEGSTVDWGRLHREGIRRRVPLPGYPFARDRHWVDPAPEGGPVQEDPCDGAVGGIDPNVEEAVTALLVPRWESAALPRVARPEALPERVVMLCGRAAALSESLVDRGLEGRVRVVSSPVVGDDGGYAAAAELLLVLVCDRTAPDAPVLLQVVHVLDGEDAGFAGLQGFVRSAEREIPSLKAQVVGLDAGLLRSPEEVRRHLDLEIVAGLPDGVVRLGQGDRQTVRWEEWAECQVPGPSAKAPESGGDFWITGASGGLAGWLADHLARRHPGCRIWMTGRRPADAGLQGLLASVRRLGASVHHAVVDVTDTQAVSVFAAQRASEGLCWNAVFHLAGVHRDGSLRRKDPRELREVLDPKTRGALHLVRALGPTLRGPLVLFASTAGVMGNAGQVDYGAANGFLDTLAGPIPGGRGRVVSIDWSFCSAGGMRLDEAALRAMRERTGLLPIPAEAAGAALDRILAAGLDRVMVVRRAAVPAKVPASTGVRAEPAGVQDVPDDAPSPEGASASLRDRLVDRLGGLFCETIRLDPRRLDIDEPLEGFGLDSILITTLHDRISAHVPGLPEAVLYERHSIRSLVDLLLERHRGGCEAWCAVACGDTAGGSTDPARGGDVDGRRVEVVVRGPGVVDRDGTMPIAIIGMSGRFPGGCDLAGYWEVLCRGRSVMGSLSPERWGPLQPGLARELGDVRGGFLEGFEEFDPIHFGIPPSEALALDPQERLILTHCWEAMEDSGHSRRLLRERYGGHVGVFVGVTKSGFRLHTRLDPDPGMAFLPVSSFSSMANRVSFHLDLVGPSLAVDTMCSSFMTALHEACGHLRRGECRMAFVGTANLYLHPRDYLDLRLGRMLAGGGEVRLFADDGDGFLPGEGAGAVLLKPLDAALEDGDPIHAVIRATAVRHGGRTHGFTVPSATGQRELIDGLLGASGLRACDIHHVECAANGSRMGDAIEWEALSGVFREVPTHGCTLGSVKPIVGHMEAASGLSQLAKVVAQMRHRQRVGTPLAATGRHPSVSLDDSPFRWVSAPEPWPVRDREPLRALVTTYGAGGSYAAAVIESGPGTIPREAAAASTGLWAFPLSARTAPALRAAASLLSRHVRGLVEDPAAVARTLQVGRDPSEHRVVVLARDLVGLASGLDAFVGGVDDAAWRAGSPEDAERFRSLFDPASIRSMVRRAGEACDLDAICGFWVQGAEDVPWAQVQGAAARRVSLPVHPLEPRPLWRIPGCPGPGGDPDGAEAVAGHVSPPAATDGRTGVVADADGVDGMRAWVARSIRELLLMRPEDPLPHDRRFFDLGLDSITAVRLVQRLGDALGRPLPETVFLDHPTVDRLARHLVALAGPAMSQARDCIPADQGRPQVSTGGDSVREEATASFQERLQALVRRHPEIVPLQTEGVGPVVFCLHPMSGDVGIHGKLADAAGRELRVIGLRSPGLGTSVPVLEDVEAMGRFHAALMMEIHDGPYWILGPSMGGVVAHEAIRALRRAGRAVGGLALLEAPAIETPEQASLWSASGMENWVMTSNFALITYLHLDPEFRRRKEAGEIRWEDLLIRQEELDAASGVPLAEQLAVAVRSRGVAVDLDVVRDRIDSMARVHLANLRAFARYRPSPIDGGGDFPVVLLRTRLGRADSDDLYTPSYLSAVQRIHGGMAPLFDAWSRLYPALAVRFIEGRDHLDLMRTPEAALEMARGILDWARAPVSTPARPVRVAVVGMAGRFPGAPDVDAFWRLLSEGRTGFSPLPVDRGWDAAGHSEGAPTTRIDIPSGGFLEDIARFDAAFFGISPGEAEMLDPSERLFLEESWRAVEDAGIDPGSLAGGRWGVFCGGAGDYNLRIRDLFGVGPSVTSSSIPGRVAYTLDLRGPVVGLDAGCASSLLAVHEACEQLGAGRCDGAIVGGVWIHSTPNLIVTGCRNEMFTRSGTVRALAAAADGMLPAEAVAVLVLKREEDALAAGDRILGVIEGWGLNHNGRTNGMAAPSSEAQAALMASVRDSVGFGPGDVDWIEVNATASRLADAVEIQAIRSAHPAGRSGPDRLWLGSVENSIGHPFQASGVVHLIKVLLALRHDRIPGTLHVDHPNPALAGATGLAVATEGRAWVGRPGAVRRALVNSSGATGINVHIAVAEARPGRAADRPRRVGIRHFAGDRFWVGNTDRVAPSGVVRPGTQERSHPSGNTLPMADLTALFQEATGIVVGEGDLDLPFERMGMESLAGLRFLALVNTRFGTALRLGDLAVHGSLAGLHRNAIPPRHPDAAPGSGVATATPGIGMVRNPALAARLRNVSDTLQLRILPGVSRPTPRSKRPPPGKSKPGERLVSAGLGVARDGDQWVVLGDHRRDVDQALSACGPAEWQALGEALPDGALLAPVSEEQERHLILSESHGSTAWNVHQVFDLGPVDLDLPRFRAILTGIAAAHDILRTTFQRSGSIWMQRVEPGAEVVVRRIRVPDPGGFHAFMIRQSRRRIPVDRLPGLRVWVAEVGGRCLAGLLMHHAVADAFSAAIIVDAWTGALLSERGSGHPLPTGQYWEHALVGAGAIRPATAAATVASDRTPVRLPWKRSPGVPGRRGSRDGEVEVLTIPRPESRRWMERFQQVGVTFSQVFAAAIATALRDLGVGPSIPLRCLVTRREPGRLFGVVGDFSAVRSLEVEVPGDLSGLDVVRRVRGLMEGVMGRVSDGVDDRGGPPAGQDPGVSVADPGEIVFDSVDLDSGMALVGMRRPAWKTLHDRLLESASGRPLPCDAPATVFLQVVRANGRFGLVLARRRHLVDRGTMRRLGTSVLRIVRRWTREWSEVQGKGQGIRAVVEDPIASAPDLLVPMNRATRGRPVFWIHPGLGGVDAYAGLASASGRPFLGIEARGWSADVPPIQGLAAMARHYWGQIRQRQPVGTLDLGGYSLGGLLAYEVARLAQGAGRRVGRIVMVDTLDPRSLRAIRISDHSRILQAVNMMLAASGLTPSALGVGWIHAAETDPSLSVEGFLEQLVELARGRGVILSPPEIRSRVARQSRVQAAYRPGAFRLRPLPRPDDVQCDYVRNTGGTFLGGLRHHYVLPGDGLPGDGLAYWETWKGVLPRLRLRDVPAASHATMLAEPGVVRMLRGWMTSWYRC